MVAEVATMPVYVYHCDECDFQFEQQQKFSDKPLKRCPECGKDSLHKVYTPVGVIYKGSGFYSTDHRSSSGANFPSRAKKEEKEKAEAADSTKHEAEKPKSSSKEKMDS
ncbi:FmdB family zinc ribbon protein [Pelolinea submarina]|nr:zinc ribbon domain-containing protein [Pelolinea submarina]